jgi:signal transduction histidine kinase
VSARRRTRLVTRITLLGVLVAVMAVVVAGFVGYRLVTETGKSITRETLSNQADVLATQLGPAAFDKPMLHSIKAVKVLQGQGITIVVHRPGGRHTSLDDRAARAARSAKMDAAVPGHPVSRTVTVDGVDYLVEARGVTYKVGFALVKPVAVPNSIGGDMLRDFLIALAVGLGVAIVAGVLLARVLSRPLRDTAVVAAAIGRGRRDLRAPIGGAAEVADVATSVNDLAEALRHSESRQRDFLLSVSHELRTPLTAIKGFAEALDDGVVARDDAARIGGIITDESVRLERLVDDLLDLARTGADEFHVDSADIDLVSLVNDGAAVWRDRCARRGLEFRAATPPHPVVVRADPRRLRQVIDILADNAVRVSPEGAAVVLSLSDDDAVARLEVRDGGPGLSDADYPVAFQRGVLHARYGGERSGASGIGLALAHALVTKMDGGLSVGPAPEGGASFAITLRSRMR